VFILRLFLFISRCIEVVNTHLLTLEQIKSLVANKRGLYKIKHPAAKSILAEYKEDASKNMVF